VITHQRRHEDIGHTDAARLPEIIEAIFGDRGGQRRALVSPIGQQPVETDGVNHGSREDVVTDLGALFQDNDRNLFALPARELLQPNRGSQPSWAAADDDDVELHGFAFDRLSQNPRSRSLDLVWGKGPLAGSSRAMPHLSRVAKSQWQILKTMRQ
jgi:hypothetical protein